MGPGHSQIFWFCLLASQCHVKICNGEKIITYFRELPWGLSEITYVKSVIGRIWDLGWEDLNSLSFSWELAIIQHSYLTNDSHRLMVPDRLRVHHQRKPSISDIECWPHARPVGATQGSRGCFRTWEWNGRQSRVQITVTLGALCHIRGLNNVLRQTRKNLF